MPREPKSPQDKKRLSLTKDRRNSYGENAKASRKNIPKSKALSHRKVRRGGKVAVEKIFELPEDIAQEVESTLSTSRLQKGRWRKTPERSRWPD